MNKIFYLSSCGTCNRIIEELELNEKKFKFQDIKVEKITNAQIEELAEKAGSYEALFSKIARKYRELKLNEKKLAEVDMKNLILEEYTFLKRPVILINDKIFIGSSKNVISGVKKII